VGGEGSRGGGTRKACKGLLVKNPLHSKKDEGVKLKDMETPLEDFYRGKMASPSPGLPSKRVEKGDAGEK